MYKIYNMYFFILFVVVYIGLFIFWREDSVFGKYCILISSDRVKMSNLINSSEL